MDPPYWIIGEAIIFKPKFNECLDDYSDIISNYRILIFSNYIDPYKTLKNNNDMYNEDENEESLPGSSFNHKLGNSLSKLVNLQKLDLGHGYFYSLGDSLLDLHNLRELTFGDHFNCRLDDSLSNLVDLRELRFGHRFNQPLNDSLMNLHNLQKLTFGINFNQPLDDCLSKLDNLRELTLGYRFNQPIVIPDGIKKLSLDCNSQNMIDFLPSNIVELEFGSMFNLELNDLPNSIKKIIIRNKYYNKKLNNLPNGIEYLEISKYCKEQIDRDIKI